MDARLSRLPKFVSAGLAGAILAASAQAAVIYSDGPPTASTRLALALPNDDELVIEVAPDGKSGWIATRVSADTVGFTQGGALAADAWIGAETAFVADDLALFRQRDGDNKSADKIAGPWADTPAGFLGFAFVVQRSLFALRHAIVVAHRTANPEPRTPNPEPEDEHELRSENLEA